MASYHYNRPDHETIDRAPDQDDQAYEEATDRIQAEYKREEFYLCEDYLHVLQEGQSPPLPPKVQVATERSDSPRTVFPPQAHHSQGHKVRRTKEKLFISPEDRASVVRYCYRITDFCDCPKEIAAISMNYFDRFLSSNLGWSWFESVHEKQRGTFMNLIFLTCLFLAMKLHGPSALHITSIAALSRGRFTVAQVAYMECLVMNALEWRLHPATALDFVRYMLDLLPLQDDDASCQNMPASQEEVYILAKLVLEMALVDYAFVTVRPSTLAFCSVLIALQSLRQTRTKERLEVTIAAAIPAFDQHSDHVHLIQDKLCLGVASQYLHLDMDDLIVDSACGNSHQEYERGDIESGDFTLSITKTSHRQGSLGSERSSKDDGGFSQYSISSDDEHSIIEANGSCDSVVDFSVYWI